MADVIANGRCYCHVCRLMSRPRVRWNTTCDSLISKKVADGITTYLADVNAMADGIAIYVGMVG